MSFSCKRRSIGIINCVMRVLCRVQHTACIVSTSFDLSSPVIKKFDENFTIGMVLMVLSKAYDCLPNDLLIVKFKAYGFGMRSFEVDR